MKTMKKIVCLLLVLVMMLTIFVGCKKDDKPDASNLKLALVVAGQFGDRSFYDSSKEGVDRLAKDLGVQVTTIECNNENHTAQMKNAADKADLVV